MTCTASETPTLVLDHLSPSSVKQYLGCSLQFYFARVLRIAKPVSPSLQLGKAVHAGAQAYHLATWRGGDASEEAISTAYRQAWIEQEEEDAVSYKSDDDRTSLLSLGWKVLQTYLQDDLAKFTEKPRGVEVALSEHFAQLPWPLVGIVDLVRAGNVPVDLKTCASTPNVELEAWQHRLQLIAYQLLIEEATGESVPNLEIVFLVKTKTPKVIRHLVPAADEPAIDWFWSAMQAAAEGIASERFFPQPGIACSWCQYRAECALWRGGDS